MGSPQHGADGRRIVDPPCEFGHTRQAMECPSCNESLSGTAAGDDWWAWYRKRTGKRAPTGDCTEGGGRT